MIKFLKNRILNIRPVELGVLLKIILNTKREWFQLSNFYLYIDRYNNFGNKIITNGKYELDFELFLDSTLNAESIFVDLGGNEGYYSVFASRYISNKGMIFCIEPQERLWNVIIKNLNKNFISNCILIKDAIDIDHKELMISLSPDINTGSTSLKNSFRKYFWPKQMITTITFDFFVEKYNITKIDVLKIDIEGFELNALLSAKKSLEKNLIKNIIVEIHPNQLKQLNQNEIELIDLLKFYNYNLKYIGDYLHFFI